MRYLPYRDLDTMGGGSTVAEKKAARKRKPWVYLSAYEKLKEERDQYRKAFMISLGIIAGLLFAQIFGNAIMKLILGV